MVMVRNFLCAMAVMGAVSGCGQPVSSNPEQSLAKTTIDSWDASLPSEIMGDKAQEENNGSATSTDRQTLAQFCDWLLEGLATPLEIVSHFLQVGEGTIGEDHEEVHDVRQEACDALEDAIRQVREFEANAPQEVSSADHQKIEQVQDSLERLLNDIRNDPQQEQMREIDQLNQHISLFNDAYKAARARCVK